MVQGTAALPGWARECPLCFRCRARAFWRLLPLQEGANSLQFSARLDTQSPIDADREFAINYYLADDTIAVFESSKRNSGILGGKWAGFLGALPSALALAAIGLCRRSSC
jgi:hypothetical protein